MRNLGRHARLHHGQILAGRRGHAANAVLEIAAPDRLACRHIARGEKAVVEQKGKERERDDEDENEQTGRGLAGGWWRRIYAKKTGREHDQNVQ